MQLQELLTDDFFDRFDPLVEISIHELEELLPNQALAAFEYAQMHGGYCSSCKKRHTALVPIHHIFINQKGDLNLQGHCRHCRGKAYALFSLDDDAELAALMLSFARRKMGWNSLGDE